MPIEYIVRDDAGNEVPQEKKQDTGSPLNANVADRVKLKALLELERLKAVRRELKRRIQAREARREKAAKRKRNRKREKLAKSARKRNRK